VSSDGWLSRAEFGSSCSGAPVSHWPQPHHVGVVVGIEESSHCRAAVPDGWATARSICVRCNKLAGKEDRLPGKKAAYLVEAASGG
jgi:hypothetical protein